MYALPFLKHLGKLMLVDAHSMGGRRRITHSLLIRVLVWVEDTRLRCAHNGRLLDLECFENFSFWVLDMSRRHVAR